MPVFNAEEAHRMLAEAIYGIPGVTRLPEEYLAATDWTSFFAVNSANTNIFVDNYIFEEPFPELEPKILENPGAIVRYAVNGLQQKWPDGEAVLLGTYPSSTATRMLRLALIYAKALVTPGRWIEFEDKLILAIAPANPQVYDRNLVGEYLYSYATRVCNERVPGIETALFNHYNPMLMVHYLKQFLVTGTVAEFETYLTQKLAAKNVDTYRAAVQYAIQIKQAEWPTLNLRLNEWPTAPETTLYKVALKPSVDLVEAETR